MLPCLSLAQVSEVNFPQQSIDFTAAPRTNISPTSIKLWDSYNNGGPTQYGTVLEIYGRTSHQTSQLNFGGWDNSRIRYREAFYAQNTWSDWITLLDSKNDVNSAGSLRITGGSDHYLSDGKLGLGTNYPGAKLHIGGSNQEIRLDYNGTNNYYGALRWAGLQFGNNGVNRIVAGRTAVGGLLDFFVNNTNEGADYTVVPDGILAMRINSNGNIGIGTTSTDFKLNIEDANPVVSLKSTSSTPWSAIRGNGSTWLFGYGGEPGAEDISIGTQDGTGSRTLTFAAGGSTKMKIFSDGNVGIGTTDTHNHKLAVNGSIRAKEIKVEAAPWPDYVFEKEYQLKSLPEVEKFIAVNKHLPEIPSAQSVANEGVNLGEMQAKLLQKIEELTLHLIEQDKKLKKQEQLIDLLIRNAESKGK